MSKVDLTAMKCAKNKCKKISDGLPNVPLTSHKMHCLPSIIRVNFGFGKSCLPDRLELIKFLQFFSKMREFLSSDIINSNNVFTLTNIASENKRSKISDPGAFSSKNHQYLFENTVQSVFD